MCQKNEGTNVIKDFFCEHFVTFKKLILTQK